MREPKSCPMCDNTGSKDHAGFAMDPCDHEQVVVDHTEDNLDMVPAKTLRDEFAMAALTGIVDTYTPEEAATYAYEYADAMMAERRKETNA